MSVKLNSSLGGSVSITEPATAGDYTVTMPAANATMLVTPIPAGNTSVAAMTLTSGSLLSTAAAGAVEYNGKVLYATPQGTQRGIVPGVQHYSTYVGLTGSNATGAQSILGVGVTLSSGTAYAFDADFNFFKAAGTTSHTFSFSWGGTATIAKVSTNLLITESVNGFATLPRSVSKLVLESASSTAVTGAISNAFYTINMRITGIVHITTGGTFIPQYALSAAPGGAYTTSAMSFLNIWPIGTSGNIVSVGAWA